MADRKGGKTDRRREKQLRESLFQDERSAWERLGARDRNLALKFAEDYKGFLDRSKTERETVAEIGRLAADAGFLSIPAPKGNTCFFWSYRGKNAALALRGGGSITDGVKIIVSHVDSPRLDLKQNPLYEDVGLGMFKTHYYGGIKKYQWLSRPLAIHGTVIRSDGKPVEIRIGEDAADPVFTINDLLPHLSQKAQYTKKLNEAIPGEKLNLLVGSIPYRSDDSKDRVKLAILKLLNDRYGIVEEDFVSAELEAVPAGVARDVGLDRSLIGAYGHDDRVCGYTSLRAMMDAGKPKGTVIALFLDKEEIGSEGNTGAQGRFLLETIGDLLAREGFESERAIRKTLANSRCLSADVNAGINPDWQSVHEPRNAAKIGHGLCITKFTGSRGKGGASDANAEFVGQIRKVLNEAKVCWHAAELGKVDEGGGGTIAKHFATHGMDVLDCGVPVLAMHSPFEVVSKVDVYMAYKAFRAFVEKA